MSGKPNAPFPSVTLNPQTTTNIQKTQETKETLADSAHWQGAVVKYANIINLYETGGDSRVLAGWKTLKTVAETVKEYGDIMDPQDVKKILGGLIE